MGAGEEEEDEETQDERRRSLALAQRKAGLGTGKVVQGVLEETSSAVLKELTAKILPAAAELKLGTKPRLLGAVLRHNLHIKALDLSKEKGGLNPNAGAKELASMLSAGQLPSLTQIQLGPAAR